MKKTTTAPTLPQDTPEVVDVQQYLLQIEKLQANVAEYKKAYETLKMKLQTIFNITQL